MPSPKCSLPLLRPLLRHLPLRYMLADKHDLVREGIKSLLDGCADLVCVCQSNGSDLIHALCQHKPDLLLTGLLLEDVSAFAVLRQCMPGMGMIVLSMCDHSLAIVESAWAGAHGFISKNESAERLLETIARVAIGERRVFPPTANLSEPELTERELTILRGITSGSTAEEMGQELCVSVKTIEVHRTQLLRRFGLRKSTDLVRLALESGVVSNSETTASPLCPKAAGCRHWQKGQGEYHTNPANSTPAKSLRLKRRKKTIDSASGKVQVSINFPVDLLRRIDALGARRNRNRSNLIADMMEQLVNPEGNNPSAQAAPARLDKRAESRPDQATALNASNPAQPDECEEPPPAPAKPVRAKKQWHHHSPQEIREILAAAERGLSAEKICKKYQISLATFYRYKRA